MGEKRQLIPLAGLFTTMAIAAYMVVQMHGQSTTATGDFTNAAVAEVSDAQGQVLLRGEFHLTDEADDDIERRAVLSPPDGATQGPRGEAEVEIARTDAATQEVEFSVERVAPNTPLTFTIDGARVAQATADAQGRAEVELDVAMPGTGTRQ